MTARRRIGLDAPNLWAWNILDYIRLRHRPPKGPLAVFGYWSADAGNKLRTTFPSASRMLNCTCPPGSTCMQPATLVDRAAKVVQMLLAMGLVITEGS